MFLQFFQKNEKKKRFSKNFKKFRIFLKRDLMIEFFFKKKFRSQKIRKEILGGICWTSGSCFQKKVNLILFERTPSKKQSEKETKQKNDRTKKFYKERWPIQKRVIFQQKRKINNRDSKNQKIGINTNRRNIRESKWTWREQTKGEEACRKKENKKSKDKFE